MNTESKDVSFEQCAADPLGTVYHDQHGDGFRFIILRGPNSLCAYVGVPKTHPLAKVDSYDNLPLRVHGGLTYAGPFPSKYKQEDGFFYWGWDHSHCDDKSFYDLASRFSSLGRDGTPWTPEMVREDAQTALWDFAALVKAAERIAAPDSVLSKS